MRRFTRSRRTATVAAIVAMATVGLAGCGTADASSGSSQPTLSSKKVTITFDWWGGAERQQRTEKAIAAFEKKYPNITVKPEFSDWSGYWDKLATMTAGNNAPDVMQMDELYLASYADRGTLYNLSNVSNTLKTSGIKSNVLDMGRSHGTLYGIPNSTAAYSVLVNKDILDKYGLKLPDTNTWTWDEFNKFAASITKASGGKVEGTSSKINSFGLELLLRQQGASLYKNGKVAATEPAMEKFFQLFLDQMKEGAAGSASAQAEQAGVSLDQMDFSTGKQAMLLEQASQMTAYSQASGANIEAVPLPTFTGKDNGYAYLKAGMYYSISSRSKHPAEAAAFVNFMVNSTEAGKILGTERGISSNDTVNNAIEPTLAGTDKAAIAYTQELEKHLGKAPEITPNGASDSDNIISRYQQDVLFGRQTPAQAASAFIKELQSDINSAAS